MDYGLWDPVQVPEGDERWFIESGVRLPDLRWCYGPPEYAPTSPIRRRQRGYITYRRFQHLAKVNAGVIGLWSRVLQKVPDSKLLLSWPTLGDAHERERWSSLFTARGIPVERLRAGRPAMLACLASTATST